MLNGPHLKRIWLPERLVEAADLVSAVFDRQLLLMSLDALIKGPLAAEGAVKAANDFI